MPENPDLIYYSKKEPAPRKREPVRLHLLREQVSWSSEIVEINVVKELLDLCLGISYGLAILILI